MNGGEIPKLQKGLRAARGAVLASIEGVTEAEAYTVPEPDEWTVAQLLAHIAEIHSFWMERAILITMEDNPQIARSTVENDLRVDAVEDHSRDSLDDLKVRVAAANDEAVAAVAKIDPADLGRPGHREANPITAAGVIEYLARHVRLHAEQITETRRIIREKA